MSEAYSEPQSSFYDEVISQNKLTAKESLTNFAENTPS